ncbi:hypothetical protein, partial [Chitinimonas sp. BJB300]|uniref:hypothetical protein n=1 Tax=Chitinimonas sp. BJB300 TaxID=1559339 RepID=UPI0027E52785
FALRAGIYAHGRCLPASEYDRLQSGRALPATILHNNSSTVSWHPEDYVLPESPVAKGVAEWRGVLSNEDYRETLKVLDRLLSGQVGQV